MTALASEGLRAGTPCAKPSDGGKPSDPGASGARRYAPEGMGDDEPAGTAGNLARIIDGHDDAKPALISRNQTVSYGELRDQVDRLRGGLAGLGLGDGDRIALLCGNTVPFVLAYLASLGLGAVTVPAQPDQPARRARAPAGGGRAPRRSSSAAARRTPGAASTAPRCRPSSTSSA